MASARLIVLALFVAGCQSWKLPAVPAGRRAQFYTQQSDGAYKYGYDTADGHFQVQEAGPGNEVRGEFGADGGRLQYTAGVGGFVVTAHQKGAPRAAASRTYYPAHTNAAAVRQATLQELITPPRPVVDTPEVAAAKASFKQAYDAAAAAAEAAPDTDIIVGGAPVRAPSGLYSAPAVTRTQSTFHAARPAPAQGAVFVRPAAPVRFASVKELTTLPRPVADTPEVAAAKRQFHQAYNAAASAAEAAPDVNIITGPAPGARRVVKTGFSHSAPAIQSTYLAPASHAGPVVTLDAAGRVQDTAEVKAAKQAFRQAYNAAAAAAEAAPDVGIITGPAPVRNVVKTGFSYSAPAIQTSYLAPAISSQHSGPVVTLDASGRVQDTAEVKAAKQAFRQAYNAAAAAAEAAPDTNIISGPSAGRRFGVQSYHSGAGYRASAAHHGDALTYRLDDGVTVMQADGARSPAKFGYTYE